MSPEVLDRPAAAIDPRLAARRREVSLDRVRRRRRRLGAACTITVVVLAAWGVTRSPLLDVDRIAVEGAERTGVTTALEASGIGPGEAMVSVDPAAAEAAVEALPWVADARVARDWPGAVRITVVERTPVAVAGEGSSAVLVDAGGRILGPAAAGDRFPAVGAAPVDGPGDLLDEDRRRLVAVLAELPEPLRSEVASGSTSGDALTLVLDDGIRVDLGDGSRLRAKSEAVAVLLEQADRATIATLDVSVPGSAALTRHDGGGA